MSQQPEPCGKSEPEKISTKCPTTTHALQAAAARAALLGHTNKVACVIWIPRHVVGTHAASEGTAYLASGGSDTNVIIWAVDTQNQCSWRKVATLGGAHTAAAGEPGVDGKPLDSQVRSLVQLP